MDIRLLDRLFILGLLILLVQLLLLCSVEEGSSEEAVERKALGQNEFLIEIVLIQTAQVRHSLHPKDPAEFNQVSSCHVVCCNSYRQGGVRIRFFLPRIRLW